MTSGTPSSVHWVIGDDVRPDEAAPDVVRTEAERLGLAKDEVDAVRQDPGPSVIDRLSERNRIDDAEAMTIALEEIAAHREARINLPLSGDEFLARVERRPHRLRTTYRSPAMAVGSTARAPSSSGSQRLMQIAPRACTSSSTSPERRRSQGRSVREST